MLDEKNLNSEGTNVFENGQYLHTDEDKITVPSSRANNCGGAPIQGIKSYRGDTSQRSFYSHHQREFGSSSVEEVNNSLKQTANNMMMPGHILQIDSSR